MLFQILVNNVFTFTPNPSKNPIMKFITAWMMFFTNDIALLNAPCRYEKKPSKSPCNNAIMAFMILVTKSITFWIAAIIGAAALITPFTILAMYVRTNSNTGFNAAMRLINACFRLSKSGCMVVHICEKASFTFPMVPSTFSLNSSFVLYKAMNPAASAAIIAITIPTGPVSADKTPLIPPILLVNPVMVFITPDIPVDIFPNMIKAGPIAAIIIPIFTIICFVLSSRFLNHVVNSFTLFTTLSIVGCNVVKMELPRSAPASFKLFIATAASSHGSNVVSNVSLTTSP